MNGPCLCLLLVMLLLCPLRLESLATPRASTGAVLSSHFIGTMARASSGPFHLLVESVAGHEFFSGTLVTSSSHVAVQGQRLAHWNTLSFSSVDGDLRCHTTYDAVHQLAVGLCHRGTSGSSERVYLRPLRATPTAAGEQQSSS